MTGAVARPIGTLHPNIAPYGETFRCADGGRIILAVGTDAQFKSLCRTIGLPHLPDDPRFSSNTERLRHRIALAQELAVPFAEKARKPLLDALIAAGVPAGAVLDIAEVMRTPAAQSMILADEVDGRTGQRIRGNAFRIEAT
jgi:crotonobetainyl-CoA:carnitine CoA-transferase CaiB-like acyl-CoA transferase